MWRAGAQRGALVFAVAVAIAFVKTDASPVAAQPAVPATVAGTPSMQPRAVLDRYCVTCHNQRLRTAGLALDTLDITRLADTPDTWEKVVQMLRAGLMPPAGRPRPDAPALEGLTGWIENELDQAARARPNPGRHPAFHRLNRSEYHNAVRDLLGLDIDVAALLPPDDGSYGFDNIGDALGVSPSLIEGYLEAAARISQDAIGNPHVGPETETYRVAPDLTQDYRLEDLPFGTRGGTLVSHYFPVDGEYLIVVKLLRNFLGGIMGLAESHQLELAVDGERAGLFTVGGKPPTARPGGPAPGADPDVPKAPVGDSHLQVRVPVAAGTRSIAVTFVQRATVVNEDLRPPYLRSFAVLSDFANGQPHVGSVAITGPFNATVGDTPTRQQVFNCRPATAADEDTCARKIFAALARRAYRRPVTDTDLAPLLEFYQRGKAGESVRAGSFDAGVQAGLQRLLASPEFLVRIERDPVQPPAPNPQPRAPEPRAPSLQPRFRPAVLEPGGPVPYRITDLELASRLSFFLWSSIPDDELLDVAERGRLKDPDVLRAQVKRMLEHPRSRALIENFAGQWLYLRNVPSTKPDALLFPDFDENLRLAFRRETELLFETVLREDSSVKDLLGARYTFVNERLARHYDIPNIYGSQFRRINLADDDPRGGLLGQGSILAVTSYPDRTSPVLRGKWILENILGAPPPPPPPDIPQLQEKNDNGQVLSMRERMMQHRANPICASCHARMDPLGLALESFDAVGQWRDKSESNGPIDATGTMPDGTQFDGPRQLRAALLGRSDRFVATLTGKLLTFALGRGLEPYDNPTVRTIVREAGRTDYRFSSLVIEIVKSPPFQMRRTPS